MPLVLRQWTKTLTVATVAETIFDSAFTDSRFAPALAIYSNNAVGISVMVGDLNVTPSNGIPIIGGDFKTLSNEQTSGENEKLFDLSKMFFNSATLNAKIIVEVMIEED